MSQGNEAADSHSLRVSGNWKSEGFLFQACWQKRSSRLVKRRWWVWKCSSPHRKGTLVCRCGSVHCKLSSHQAAGSSVGISPHYHGNSWRKERDRRNSDHKLFIHTPTDLYGLTPITDLYHRPHTLLHTQSALHLWQLTEWQSVSLQHYHSVLSTVQLTLQPCYKEKEGERKSTKPSTSRGLTCVYPKYHNRRER